MKLFIVGDSTASIKLEEKRPEAGWGEKIGYYFNDQVQIVNIAQNGRSTKSFLNEKRLEEIIPMFNKGDYLFIQFGHNDGKKEDENRFTKPFSEYQENLKIFINEARKKEVIPVLLTSVSRRKFLEDQKTMDPFAVEDYPEAAKQLGEKEKVVVLDLFKETQALYEYLGYEMSKGLFLQMDKNVHPNYPEGVIDNTHFCDLGAKMIASLVANEILKSDLKLKDKIVSTKILSFEKIKEEMKNKKLYE